MTASDPALPSGRRLAIAASIALVGTIGLLVGGLTVAGAPPAQRLPDGSRLSLLGTAYGSPAIARSGALLPRMFARLFSLPGDFAPSRAVTLEPAPQELLVGMAQMGPDPRVTLPYCFEIADDRGARVWEWPDSRDTSQSPNSELSALAFPMFPRRGKLLHLRVHSLAPDRRWRPSAEFTVPNPARGPFPTWLPEAAGAIHSAGDLSVSLLGVEDGTPFPSLLRSFPMPPELTRGTRIRVRIDRNGRAATDWEPVTAVFSDPTGNRDEPVVNSSRRLSASENELVLNTRLVSSESVWRTDLEISRCAGFRRSELACFHGVPVPGTGSKMFRNRTISLVGGTVTMDMIVRLASRDRRTGFMGTHTAQLTWTFPSVPGYRMRIVRVVDQRGREVPFRHEILPFPGFTRLGTTYTPSLPLAIPNGVKTIDITCALSRSRYVRFVSTVGRRN